MRPNDSTTASVRALTRRSRILLVLSAMAVLGISLGVRYAWTARSASADAPPARPDDAAPKGPDGQQQPDVVAVVNGDKISRNDLAREALLHYGEDVLESIVNKHLISEHCKQQNIVITGDDVKAGRT